MNVEDVETDGDEHPRGTLLLTLLFLGMVAGLWVATYVLLLSRG